MQSTATYVLTREVKGRLGDLNSEFIESPPIRISLLGAVTFYFYLLSLIRSPFLNVSSIVYVFTLSKLQRGRNFFMYSIQ